GGGGGVGGGGVGGPLVGAGGKVARSRVDGGRALLEERRSERKMNQLSIRGLLVRLGCEGGAHVSGLYRNPRAHCCGRDLDRRADRAGRSQAARESWRQEGGREGPDGRREPWTVRESYCGLRGWGPARRCARCGSEAIAAT